jgi:hypothetical protein
VNPVCRSAKGRLFGVYRKQKKPTQRRKAVDSVTGVFSFGSLVIGTRTITSDKHAHKIQANTAGQTPARSG